MAESDRKNRGDLSALVVAVACGKPLKLAAAMAGMSERTARRRLKDAAVKAKVEAARGELVKAALGRLASDMTEAAGVLRDLLGSSLEQIKLAAARSILGLGGDLWSRVDLNVRLDGQEARLAEIEGKLNLKRRPAREEPERTADEG